jgi:WhiB family redox-sensing transcriptional regulator
MSDWWLHALCRGVDPELFFPHSGENGTEAKAYCRACPVRAECLQFALDWTGYRDYGIWGGTSAAEREQMRRNRRAAERRIAAIRRGVA